MNACGFTRIEYTDMDPAITLKGCNNDVSESCRKLYLPTQPGTYHLKMLYHFNDGSKFPNTPIDVKVDMTCPSIFKNSD